MRLIDADALIAKLKTQYGEELGWQCTVNMSDVGMMIEDAPTVDATPVVRCKDCKYWHKDIGWCDKHSHFVDEKDGACHPWESPNWKMFDADDFCSYGERKASE